MLDVEEEQKQALIEFLDKDNFNKILDQELEELAEILGVDLGE